MVRIQANQALAGVFSVTGDLDFESVPELLAQSAALIWRAKGQIDLDLQDVGRSDSAGLALLIEWLSIARRRRQKIRFLHVPEQMLAMARVSGLESVLGLK